MFPIEHKQMKWPLGFSTPQCPHGLVSVLLLEEALLVLLALVVAVDDLQQEAGQGDQLAVRGGEHALEQRVAGLVEQDQDGQWILHLRQKNNPGWRRNETWFSPTHTVGQVHPSASRAHDVTLKWPSSILVLEHSIASYCVGSNAVWVIVWSWRDFSYAETLVSRWNYHRDSPVRRGKKRVSFPQVPLYLRSFRILHY